MALRGSLPCATCLLVPMLMALPCAAVQAERVSYRGIRPSDPGGRDGLRNPERGLRIETLIAEPPGLPAWGPANHLKGSVSEGFSDEWWVLDATRYERHGLTLAQTYCYMDPYVGQPLPDEKLEWLRQSFAALRASGLKAVLRFAYERDISPPTGPTMDDIRRHMAQLAPVIRDNLDVVYVMQAGFIGAWGEWHSSANQLEADHASLAAVIEGILDILPPEFKTQVRVPKYKRWALSLPGIGEYEEVNERTAFDGSAIGRVGFANDGFLAGETCGGTWTEPPLYSNPGNPEFDTMTRESAYVPVDGELFWSDVAGAVDGLTAAVRLRLHHYSSFSLAHSFSEREGGGRYSIDTWMRTEVTPDTLEAQRMPLSDGYFEDTAGEPVARTIFEYIRDHLGYRLELQEARFARRVRSGDPLDVRVSLINRGFSIPHLPRPVQLVLVDAVGNVVAAERCPADPRRWQPYEPGDESFAPLTHRFGATLRTAGLRRGVYRLGLAMPDAHASLRGDPRYAIRVANGDVPWVVAELGLGVNVLGEVAIR